MNGTIKLTRQEKFIQAEGKQKSNIGFVKVNENIIKLD